MKPSDTSWSNSSRRRTSRRPRRKARRRRCRRRPTDAPIAADGAQDPGHSRSCCRPRRLAWLAASTSDRRACCRPPLPWAARRRPRRHRRPRLQCGGKRRWRRKRSARSEPSRLTPSPTRLPRCAPSTTPMPQPQPQQPQPQPQRPRSLLLPQRRPPRHHHLPLRCHLPTALPRPRISGLRRSAKTRIAALHPQRRRSLATRRARRRWRYGGAAGHHLTPALRGARNAGGHGGSGRGGGGQRGG